MYVIKTAIKTSLSFAPRKNNHRKIEERQYTPRLRSDEYISPSKSAESKPTASAKSKKTLKPKLVQSRSVKFAENMRNEINSFVLSFFLNILVITFYNILSYVQIHCQRHNMLCVHNHIRLMS